VTDIDSGAPEPTCFGVALTAAAASDEPAQTGTRLRERLDRFCDALAQEIGAPVVPHVAADYRALLEALVRHKVDVAWLPPVLALRAAAEGRALPIALPVRHELASFYTALFAKAGTPIRRVTDLKRVRAAWVDRNSASGYLVIRAALRAQGVRPEQAFAEERFFGSHETVVEAVMNGEADVGATFLHRTSTESRAGWGDHNVHVIARVGPIPADVIAASVHQPVARIRQVQEALTSSTRPELVQAAAALFDTEGFVKAESSHLQPLEQLLEFLEDTAYRFTSQLPPAP
jgi:phosphate/phosphite/phosphonate ABC transporter binding protein